MQKKSRIARNMILLSLALCVSACASSPRTESVERAKTATHKLAVGNGATASDAQLEARYQALLRDIHGDAVDVHRPPAETVPAPVKEPAVMVHEAPLPSEPPSGLTVQPEAILRIRVKEDPSLDGQYAVNEIGAINLDYIGPIILFNYTEAQAAEKIREVLVSRAFRNATVEVDILRASYDRIGVEGMVNQAGIIRIGAGDAISLNDALLRAGGLRGTASGLKARIVRGGLTNVLAAAQDGEVYPMQGPDGQPAVPRVWLRNNDKAIVFSVHAETRAALGDKEVLVLGEVSREGPVRFSSGEPATMMRLAFKIGGFPRYANTRRVTILRRDDRGVETERVVNVQRILETGDPDLDIQLMDGDRIIVPARRLSFF